MGELTCGMCGARGDHEHFAVVVYENSQELGRLTPDKTTTSDRYRAAIFSRKNAKDAAAVINSSQTLSATVVPF